MLGYFWMIVFIQELHLLGERLAWNKRLRTENADQGACFESLVNNFHRGGISDRPSSILEEIICIISKPTIFLYYPKLKMCLIFSHLFVCCNKWNIPPIRHNGQYFGGISPSWWIRSWTENFFQRPVGQIHPNIRMYREKVHDFPDAVHDRQIQQRLLFFRAIIQIVTTNKSKSNYTVRQMSGVIALIPDNHCSSFWQVFELGHLSHFGQLRILDDIHKTTENIEPILDHR